MDRCRLWRTLIICMMTINLGWCQPDGSEQIAMLMSFTASQGQLPVGAYRVFPKTSFSCLGRPAGYYADIETGCQVYHMCDGLGRQFSYSCPNTTLFQQRMLICDHWYMVNCSRAESDYAANLLIGQRDKPFVPEEENQLRTPRPDLLDRPYAPDYSGESFRNQYKQLPSIQNEIIDYNSEKFHKPTPTRWHINRPSSVILPPSHPSQPPVISRRMDQVEDTGNVDLGTSFSSNYNSSADITASGEDRAIPEKSPDSNIIIPSIKPPSKLYEPPFLYPIWNENYTAEEEEPSSTVPTTSTTIPLFNRQSTTFGGRPFNQVFPTTTTFLPPTQQSTISTVRAQEETFPPRGSTHNDYDFSKYSTRQTNENEDRAESTTVTTSTTTESSFTSPSTRNPLEADFGIPSKEVLLPPAPFTAKSEDPEVAKPSLLILPPFSEYTTHDVATTQGPPIYYEWKIPSNALEPPKLDPPIGVNGRKEEDSSPETNDSLSTATSFVDNTAEHQPRPFSHNPFLAPIVNKSQRSVTAKTATPRSIQAQAPPQTTQPNSLFHDTKESNKSSSQPPNIDIEKLRKDWSVPDFLFPLENDARTGYEHADIFNSFQVKIPERRSENSKRWYGENADCPECHPSFVKPGTCEPCVKRR